ncbi:MAG TPA: hypothetical protein VKG44_02285 [Candidatus Baltobacteraceae bacterium]|nr:hypothetical protein [Candidatus Baltobacteraceae bacterium]
MKPWTLATLVVGSAMFVLAISNEVYALTSPYALSWHVLLRKAYSVAAFTLVGVLYRRSLEERGRAHVARSTILGLSLYSACIEVAQALLGSREGLAWNAFDIACGTLGGALAPLADRFVRSVLGR